MTGASLSGNNLTITIENGTPTTVDLSSLVDDADAVVGNEYNTAFSLSGRNLLLTDGGGTRNVDLSSLVNDADAVIGNEYNTGISLAGTNLTVTDGGGNQTVNIGGIRRGANNGLNVDGNNIQLGGTLVEQTTITQGAFNMIYNLNNTGDFVVQDNGTNQFVVQDNGDVRADNNSLYVDASTDRVGIGTTAPGEKLHVVGDIMITGGTRSIETQNNDLNIQLDDANPTWNGDVYGGITRFHGDGNLAGSKLEAGGLQLERRIQIKGGAPGNGKVLTSDAAGNATWQTPTNGDITGVNAGAGLSGGGGGGTVTLNVVANNGLYVNGGGDRVRLGGNLVEPTTITQGAHPLRINLNGTGDFEIQDDGTNKFSVLDNGNALFGGDVYWRDVNTAGTNLMVLSDDGDDGRLRIYENGAISIDLDANSQFVFNEQGLNRDFRVESDARPNMLWVDANEDLVRVGTNSATSDWGNGGNVGGIVVDYVADFDKGTATGTAVGIGSIEYLLDHNSETSINNNFTPTTHLDKDLGRSTTVRAWDDVYADNFVNVSDKREKDNIENLNYGLAEILQMRPVSYTLKRDPFQETKLGLIAQEALILIPEAVKTHDHKQLDESKPDEFTKVEMERMGMTYQQLIPVLIKATQEQQAQIEALKAEIEALKAAEK